MQRVCHSQSSESQTPGSKEKRPSGLGHTVAATTRDAARTPLQPIITVGVGRNKDGENTQRLWEHFPSLLTVALILSVHPPSLSHSFFPPLEIVLLTWVYKSFLCFPIYSHFAFATLAFFIQEENSVSAASEHLGKSLLLLFEWAASSLTIGSIQKGDKQRSDHIHSF